MNLNFCPNKKSKEFKELSSIFGEDKAYFLWMRNGGNHLDKAPNGADSKLFNTLLEEFNGNRTLALKAKAKVYSNSFFSLFGNWTGIESEKDFGEVSKAVDENGEPDASAVYNGTYNNLRGRDIKTVQDVKDALSKILTRQIGFRKSRTSDQITYSRTSISKEQATKILEATLSLFNLPKNAAYISTTGWIRWDNIVLNLYILYFKDAIDQSKNTSLFEKSAIASFLIHKFKHIKGIQYKSLSGENGRFEDGVVILNKDASLDVAAEECLHPFVAALKSENIELFNSLLREARKEFPKLNLEIEERYGNKNNQDTELELVTQALSRHFADLWLAPVNQETGEKEKSIWVKALEYILDLFRFNRIDFIDSNVTLRQLAEAIYKSEDIGVDSIYFNRTYHNLSNNQSINSENVEQDIKSRRQEYIDRVLRNREREKSLSEDEKAKIRNAARVQFDEQELNRITTDDNLSDKEKNIARGLLLNDLEIALGIQHIDEQQNGKEIFRKIKEGTKTRLKSLWSRNIKNTKLINDLRNQLDLMEGVNEDSVEDVFSQIENFLLNAEREILTTKRFIERELKGKDISTWNPQQINYIKYDLLGHYEGLLNTIYNLFKGTSAIVEYNKQRVLNDDMATDLKQLSEELYKTIKVLEADYQQSVVRPYADKVLVDFVNDSDVIKDKPLFIANMRKWLDQDTVYGDLAAGEINLGMASRSRSNIVRIIEKMISDVEFEHNRQVLTVGNELIRLYNKVRPKGSQIDFRNFQTLFMERSGEDGTGGSFTGYFVRDRNYGRFYAEKDAFEESLRAKYAEKGLTWKYDDVQDRVVLLFPENEDPTNNNSVYNLYYDELDQWLDKRCERKYTLEYYKKKRRFLSPAALHAQQFIQRQIDLISQNALTEDGWVDTSKLSPSERQRRSDLIKQKRELASPYIFKTLSDGTVTLEEKVGEDAEVAKQIRKWNDFVSKHVKYKQNDKKFKEALSKFKEGSDEYKQFIKDNTIKRINPEFWETIFGSNTIEQTAEYKDLLARYRFIVDHIKHREGFVTPDLDLLGTGINTDTSAWKELLRIEQRMAEIRKTSDNTVESRDYLLSFLVLSTRLNTDYLSWLKNQWVLEISENPSAQQVFDSLFTFKDAKGTIRSLKIFSFVAPSAFSIQNKEGKTIPTIIDTYSSQFSELDESSDFVNPNWDKSLKASLQPKIRKAGTKRIVGSVDYTNENYNTLILNDGYKQLYDKLISIIEEANKMIPSGAVERRYLLPQITGRGMSILGRSRSFADIFSAINYGIQDFAGVKFLDGKLLLDNDLSERDLDVSTNWDLPRRPDGSVVCNIPIRFVKRLKDPSIVSSDIIGSVLMYYDMALNYKLKSENLPSLELITEATRPQKEKGDKSLRKQHDKIKNLLDYRYYGRESRMGDDDVERRSEVEKSTMQVAKKFKNLASLAMLGLNFTTIEVGYLDAFLSAIADACGGKYFTKRDLLTGYCEFWKHFPKMMSNLGNPVVEDWMVAAMLYNQLSKSNSEIFNRTNLSKFSRLLAQTRMGGYTLADYAINTMIVGATYNHYRLITMPDGSTKKFMSKSDAIDTFTKVGYTEDEAISKWENSKTTLKQAYYQENGLLKIKDEFKQYVTKKLENQIAGRLRDRTAVYNGVIPATEKAACQQNVFGSYLTLMRNYFVNTYWERFQTGSDYMSEEGQASNKFGSYTSDTAGYTNFETGETSNGLYVSCLLGLRKYVHNVKALITHKDTRQLTRDQKYAVKRILAEVVMIGSLAFLMLWSIAFARTNDYDDDKDPVWTINIFDPEGEDKPLLEFNGKNAGDKMLNWLRWKMALLSTRLFTERSTFYWPGTITELITSPSTAKSYLDDVGYSLELFMDLFLINGHDRSDVIKSGGYKGMTRGTRDILKITKFTGVDNLVRGWHTSGIKSTLNWYSGVAPNNFLIPTKKVWEELNQQLNNTSNTKHQNLEY